MPDDALLCRPDAHSTRLPPAHPLLSPHCLGWSILFFLAGLTVSQYVASVPFIQVEWGLNGVQASLLFSIYLVGYAISSLIFVPLSDRFPTHMTFLAGILAMCIPNLLFPLLATDFWSGALLRFIAGAGQVLSYTSGIQLVAARFDPRMRTTAVSIFVGLAYGGSTVSYVVMGLLLQSTSDWREAYLLLAGVSSISVLGTLVFIRIPSLRLTTPPPTSSRRTGRLDFSLLGNRPIMLAIAGYAIHTADLYVVRLWLPLLIGALFIRQGMAPSTAAAQASTLAGTMFMLGAVSVMVGGWIADRWGRVQTAVCILLLSAICSGSLGWLIGAPAIFIITVGFLYGFLGAADSAIYSTTLLELAPEGKTGSVQALQSFLGFTAGAAMPVIVGWLIDITPASVKWGSGFTFNGLLSVAAVFCMVSLKKYLTPPP